MKFHINKIFSQAQKNPAGGYFTLAQHFIFDIDDMKDCDEMYPRISKF